MQPPLLPAQWESSYVSYFSPMRPGDLVTNGYAWFDYERGVSRIDGFVNPWDEAAAGYRLWVSEVNWFAGTCHRVQMAYTADGEAVRSARLPDEDAPSRGPAVARDLLRVGPVQARALTRLHGREVVRWALGADLRRTLYTCAASNAPLRLCTEKQPGHHSVRDFLTVRAQPISADVFDRAAWPEVSP